jgi:hypothetical protein
MGRPIVTTFHFPFLGLSSSPILFYFILNNSIFFLLISLLDSTFTFALFSIVCCPSLMLLLRFKLLLGFFSIHYITIDIDRTTEKYTITRDTTFILGNPHGGEKPTKTSLI